MISLNPEEGETNLNITVKVEVIWKEVFGEIILRTPDDRSGQTNVEQKLVKIIEKNLLGKNLSRCLRRNLLRIL